MKKNVADVLSSALTWFIILLFIAVGCLENNTLIVKSIENKIAIESIKLELQLDSLKKVKDSLKILEQSK